MGQAFYWGVAAAGACGAVAGLCFAFVHGGFADAGGEAFIAWLQYPIFYWPMALMGALVGILGFSAIRLATGRRHPN
jgi:hypothetical protein